MNDIDGPAFLKKKSGVIWFYSQHCKVPLKVAGRWEHSQEFVRNLQKLCGLLIDKIWHLF